MADEDARQLIERTCRGAGRALDEVNRAAQDLAQPWPRVPDDVLGEGRHLADRAATALRNLMDALTEAPGGGRQPPRP